jgi:hypothetical protein
MFNIAWRQFLTSSLNHMLNVHDWFIQVNYWDPSWCCIFVIAKSFWIQSVSVNDGQVPTMTTALYSQWLWLDLSASIYPQWQLRVSEPIDCSSDFIHFPTEHLDHLICYCQNLIFSLFMWRESSQCSCRCFHDVNGERFTHDVLAFLDRSLSYVLSVPLFSKILHYLQWSAFCKFTQFTFQPWCVAEVLDSENSFKIIWTKQLRPWLPSDKNDSPTIVHSFSHYMAGELALVISPRGVLWDSDWLARLWGRSYWW